MTLSGCREVSTSLTVNRGSSCSTVPMPVRIAQERARQRCPSARAAGPGIHWLAPLSRAVLPSRVAWLQRHVERRAAGRFAARLRIGEGPNFRVGFASALVPTFADHASITDEDAAYARIRGRREQSVRGKIECAPHALAIAVIERHVGGAAESHSARLAPRRHRLDFLQRVAKVCSILKAAIHRGEADVADLVELVELLHD